MNTILINQGELSELVDGDLKKELDEHRIWVGYITNILMEYS